MSIQKKKKNKNHISKKPIIFANQTVPEVYLPAPVFPYSPTTQSILGTPSMSSIADEDLLQIIPDDCYWLGGAPSQFSHNQSIENATVFRIKINKRTFIKYV